MNTVPALLYMYNVRSERIGQQPPVKRVNLGSQTVRQDLSHEHSKSFEVVWRKETRLCAEAGSVEVEARHWGRLKSVGAGCTRPINVFVGDEEEVLLGETGLAVSCDRVGSVVYIRKSGSCTASGTRISGE